MMLPESEEQMFVDAYAQNEDGTCSLTESGKRDRCLLYTSRYLNHEFGCVYKPEAGFRFCMMYPDTYELGQANQALRILRCV